MIEAVVDGLVGPPVSFPLRLGEATGSARVALARRYGIQGPVGLLAHQQDVAGAIGDVGDAGLRVDVQHAVPGDWAVTASAAVVSEATRRRVSGIDVRSRDGHVVVLHRVA